MKGWGVQAFEEEFLGEGRGVGRDHRAQSLEEREADGPGAILGEGEEFEFQLGIGNGPREAEPQGFSADFWSGIGDTAEEMLGGHGTQGFEGAESLEAFGQGGIGMQGVEEIGGGGLRGGRFRLRGKGGLSGEQQTPGQPDRERVGSAAGT